LEKTNWYRRLKYYRPECLGIVLMEAHAINRKGEILAMGKWTTEGWRRRITDALRLRH
jgi:hypothetical protein